MEATKDDLVRPMVVEIQCFYDNNNEFVVKELAVVDVLLKHYFVAHFKPPLWNLISSKAIRSAKWLTKHLHGLKWEDGILPYSNELIRLMCLAYVANDPAEQIRVLIYTKGLEKKRFLHTLLNGIVQDVIDLNSLDGSGRAYPNSYCTPHSNAVCPISEHKDNSLYSCSLKTALKNSEWLLEHKEYLKNSKWLLERKKLHSYNLSTPLTVRFHVAEKSRLKSFGIFYEEQLDKIYIPTYTALARLGFYYDAYADKVVRCFKCGLNLDDITVEAGEKHALMDCKPQYLYNNSIPVAAHTVHYN
jgi:hypothetical protein